MHELRRSVGNRRPWQSARCVILFFSPRAANWRDYPFSWTEDSKAVLFSSDRAGTFHIFKQGIGESAPELLIEGAEETSLPRLAPDNSTILFEVWPRAWGARVTASRDAGTACWRSTTVRIAALWHGQQGVCSTTIKLMLV